MGHRTEIINLSHGGGQPNISQGIIRNIRIAIPPLELQSKIVTFVDKKFEETNQLINKKKKMIKLLELQRQSINHHRSCYKRFKSECENERFRC
ncbi:hypothetical protein BsIDN1_59390 [Bacillus safensis]|uniref:Type I restriction modification DNA specificity domain-containing protein n=1 Tax=Bacillus safensis TaxID=561879 RepID=A0A5S9MH94_BACIA|nr:hypothetical protein BsIDN1_59390 [Bacillus safensis]